MSSATAAAAAADTDAAAAAAAAASEKPPVQICKGINGLDKVVLRDFRGSSVEIYLYGAHVTSWKNEHREELLFVSSKAIFKPPKAIRGGIPICFPQFSNLGPLEAHGFARNRFWSIDPSPPPFPVNSSNKTYVDLLLKPTEDDMKIWPHGFEFPLRVTLGPAGDLMLTSRIRNTNPDGKPFTFTFAYHTYFSVSDIRWLTAISGGIRIPISMDYYEEEDCSQETGSDWSVGEEEEMAVAAAVDGRKSYKVMTEEEISHLQDNDINTVSGVLAVPRGVATTLLCRNNWSITSAYDHWFAAAGEGNPAPVPRDSVQRNCNICFEKIDMKESVSAACGHPFCAGCLRSYIAAAVSGGAGCLTLDCPQPGCGAAVTSDLVEKLVSAADLSRYNQYLLRSYVESSRNRKWCPSPGCDLAVELEEVGIGSYDVVCDCSFEFCWGCTGEPHTPLSCAAAAEWCESASWILANTKPCPSCRRPIEKSDDGCNHMVCVAPCRFQFCWNCSNEWLHHHSLCSHCLFRREWSKKEIEEEKPKPERFAGGNCYERWDFNKISRANAVEALAKARSKYAGEEGGGMEFVIEAWEQIVEGWRVLIWSYVYVHGLPEVVTKRAVLEHFQTVATQALDRLQCCVEDSDKRVRRDTPEYWQFRREAKELAKVAANYFESLVLLMTDKVESYALNWEKEALELKNEIAIAESYANDMEVEDLEARDAAIVACYAHDLEEMEMEVDLITKSVPASETEEDIFFDSKNAEVGTAPLDWNRRFAEFESPAFDSKDGIAETGSSVFEQEKEVPNVKNNFAQSVSYLDSEQEAKEAIELKNDLAEAEGEAKEGIDTKSDSSESDQSYVFVSDKDKESDLDESYVFLSDEERHT